MDYNKETLFPNGHWLLCPPTYFDVKYEINPWMNTDRTPLSALAAEQWRKLHHALIRLGAYVEYVEPVRGNPDLVFTANAGLVLGRKCVLSKFKFKERQGEEAVFRTWFEQRGYEVLELSSCYFEGEGDALFCGNTLVCGHGHRSDKEAYKEIQSLLDIPKLIYCELVDERYYHLDICFCPLEDGLAIYNEDGIAQDSIAELKKHFEMVPVPKKDAERFVCNAVVLGKSVVVPGGCEQTQKLLQKLGYDSYGVQLGEFLKGGGAAKCLSLQLDRSLPS